MGFLMKFFLVLNVVSAIANIGMFFTTGSGFSLVMGVLNAGVSVFLVYVIAQDD